MTDVKGLKERLAASPHDDPHRALAYFADLEAKLAVARDLLHRGVHEALPDAMIFAAHTDPKRYRKAVEDMRAWTADVKAALNTIGES